MKHAIFYLVILAAGSALFLFHNGGTERFGLLAPLIPGAFITVAIGIIYRHRTEFIKELQFGAWAIILATLMFIYMARDEILWQSQRLLAALLPGHVIEVGTGKSTQVLIYKADGAHFQAPVNVNGREIVMLVDTGASEIVLSNDDARTLGLLTDGLQYEVLVHTAGGTSVTAPVTLDIVSVGPIKRRAIQALVSPAGELRQSLLGMTFISTLKSFQMKSDELRFED